MDSEGLERLSRIWQVRGIIDHFGIRHEENVSGVEEAHCYGVERFNRIRSGRVFRLAGLAGAWGR